MNDSHVNDILVMPAIPCLCHPGLMSDHVLTPSAPSRIRIPCICPFLCCLFAFLSLFLFCLAAWFPVVWSVTSHTGTTRGKFPRKLWRHTNHAGLYHPACHLQINSSPMSYHPISGRNSHTPAIKANQDFTAQQFDSAWSAPTDPDSSGRISGAGAILLPRMKWFQGQQTSWMGLLPLPRAYQGFPRPRDWP